MKGNKPLTYVLIGGVLLVWGVIFFRVFMGTAETTPSIVSPRSVIRNEKQNSFARDTFDLLLSYRDPFLSNTARTGNGFASFYSGQANGNVKAVKKKVKVKEPVVEIDWSFISYLGLVNNKVQKKNIGLMVVNGKEYMINEGDRIEEITVLKKAKDSIQVSYKEQKKWIRRQ
jgi:hypothetical protein